MNDGLSHLVHPDKGLRASASGGHIHGLQQVVVTGIGSSALLACECVIPSWPGMLRQVSVTQGKYTFRVFEVVGTLPPATGRTRLMAYLKE